MGRAKRSPWDYPSILLTIEIRRGAIDATWTAQGGDQLKLPARHKLARRVDRLMRDLHKESENPTPVPRRKPAKTLRPKVAKAPRVRSKVARPRTPEKKWPGFRDGDYVTFMDTRVNGRVQRNGTAIFDDGSVLSPDELIAAWKKGLGWVPNGRQREAGIERDRKIRSNDVRIPH